MPIKILYVLPPSKVYAGIERVFDCICDELAGSHSDKFDITVVHSSKYIDYELGQRKYKLIQLDIVRLMQLLFKIRQIVIATKSEVVVIPQVAPVVICWLACLGLKTKFVLCLHSNFVLDNRSRGSRLLYFMARTVVFNRLIAVFGISLKQLNVFSKIYSYKRPLYWTPNPVRAFDIHASKFKRDPNGVTFVNISRFTYQKGQDLLIPAFADVLKICPNARLKLVGLGETKTEIEALIEKYNISDAVSIDYYPSDPSAALYESDVYVSTSRWEGWGLAVCEAMRFGIPVIAVDCDFGPSDIITDARLGLLVPLDDNKSLVDAMLYYINNIDTERRYYEYRVDYINKFNLENILPLHLKALSSVAGLDKNGDN